MDSEGILVPISFFLLVYGIIHLYVRRKERLSLIEKGADASIFYSNKRIDPSLKYGLLLIGVGVGMLIGNFLSKTEAFNQAEELAYFSMVFLFGGISLLIYYFINKIYDNKVEENKYTKKPE
ncbi:MAG: hypothetical protein K8S18_13980 [Desulfobacula sp.]|nr:hypothetical protein [Desulfobacula sp.]